MRSLRLAVIAVFVFVAFTVTASMSTQAIDFEPPYPTGTINGQFGWSSLGAAGSGCGLYDHTVVLNSGSAPVSFGTQSLRMSNAVTSGCFGDQTFSPSIADEAGEISAMGDGQSGGARQPRFTGQWSFMSTVPSDEQPGLSVVVSPDRGDGARMSWVQMTDTSSGLAVNFNEYRKASNDFAFSNVASGLNRAEAHTIKIVMDFYDGSANDVVKIYVDGVLSLTGTSWEDYFRDVEHNPTRTVDSLLFRTGGPAAPLTAGYGFLIDNVVTSSGPIITDPPTSADECKNGGWRNFNNPSFRNQGDCVSSVLSHRP